MTSKRIVINGPESTGKTELSKSLATYFNTFFIPEYARNYIGALPGRYQFEDVLHIARIQIETESRAGNLNVPVFFEDTDLIITKVWLDLVFGECPPWITNHLENNRPDLYLLCYPDLPWIPDKTRENGGEMRNHLFNIYKREIEMTSVPFVCISGRGEERLKGALDAVFKSFL